MTSSHKKNTIEQARLEIENIKEKLIFTKFEGVWLSSMIRIHGRDIGPVPKTVFEAYTALRHYEKDDPVKALAAFYAKFAVANMPVFDHTSRDEKTRRFYSLMATQKLSDIFPDNPDAVTSFSALLRSEVKAEILKKSPEQKKFLDFEANVNIEVKNIESMDNQLEAWARLLEYENKTDILANDFAFLSKVIERMKVASISDDVELYAKDALLILDKIMTRVGHDAQLKEIKKSIEQFQQFHIELMNDVNDQEKALYYKSVLQLLSVSIGSHLIQHSGDFHSSVPNIVEFGLGIGLKKLSDKENIGPKLENPALHHIHAVNKKDSLSDTFVKTSTFISQRENKDRLTAQGGMVMSVALFPALAVPVAVTSVLYGTGGIVRNLYAEKNQLNELRKIAKQTRDQHQGEMENYRRAQNDQHQEEEAPQTLKRRAS